MTRHETIFRDYLAELREVHGFVTKWWAHCIERERGNGLDEAAAERALLRRWPMGSASHPRVIEIYRRYYLLCEKLNDVIESGEKADPSRKESTLWGSGGDHGESREEYPIETFEFLLDWLVEDHQDLHIFVAHLVFEPIGNENG